MDNFNELLDIFLNFLNYELFSIGKSTFSVKIISIILISFFGLFFLSNKLKKILTNSVLLKYGLDIGESTAIASIVQYSTILIGTMIILESSGIDLTALGFLVGALGIGIGFGLQNITSNFISGIIILFERPIKVGDRIEVGNLSGNVVKIATRATTIVTNDNINVIVPNSEFINSRVVNWSLNDRKVRINIPVDVSYKEDPENIKKLLLEVAKENPDVLTYPETDVLFEAFGDSSLKFNLRVWTIKYIDKPLVLKSHIYYAISKKFKTHHIEIPYPQRDLHIKTPIQIQK